MLPFPHMKAEIPKTYEPRDHEDAIYRTWEESDLFNPDTCIGENVTAPDAPPFSIVLPPPNVTGTLHLGHAAMLAIEDIMVRYHRMRGDRTLWIPGTDHAAIATQEKVERILWNEEQKTRHDLGREAFLDRVRKFAQDSHDTIVNQCKKMGASLDWSRETYTLDTARNHAVNEAFRRMFEDGIIYRGSRIVNWDPKFQTTVSDDEVERREEEAPFYYLQYGPFVIGTARPETKFGDKYVVVHPNDDRYAQYTHGQRIENIEWINGKITATVIKDEAIDMNFGTGAMTITPWHDATDFDIAERHGLDKEQIIGYNGKLLEIAGEEFVGMNIAEARVKIVEKLREKNLIVKAEEEYVHNIAVNSRGGGIIEPQIKEQWFVNVNKEFERNGKKTTLKSLMQEAVRSNEIKIIPERFEKVYFHWIDNLRDWCISRQIWFGHRIPVWYDMGAEENIRGLLWLDNEKNPLTLTNEQLKTIDQAGSKYGQLIRDNSNEAILLISFGNANLLVENKFFNWSEIQSRITGIDIDSCKKPEFFGEKPNSESFIQDPDTLDTWFSSGLWTFSTLGWPKKKEDFEIYHPNSVLETGYDILFFWVARMILMSEYLLNDTPFKTVYLHGLVRDEKGRKMSKSLGNVIDPLDMTTRYGTDAVRLALVIGSTPGNDIRIGEEKIASFRNFTNKLWNIGRYVAQQTVNGERKIAEDARQKSTGNMRGATSDADHWILSRLNKTVGEVTRLLENYQFSLAGETLRDFTWNDFADWYVEIHKIERNDTVLRYAFETLLKLWHPFMPFVTEALWKHLGNNSLLMVAPWPEATTEEHSENKESFAAIIDIITHIRTMRAAYRIDAKHGIAVTIACQNAELIETNASVLKRLARIGELSIADQAIPLIPNAAQASVGNARVFLHLEGLIDGERERARLQTELNAVETFIKNTATRLANAAFVAKAPTELIENTEKLLAEQREKRVRLQSALEALL